VVGAVLEFYLEAKVVANMVEVVEKVKVAALNLEGKVVARHTHNIHPSHSVEYCKTLLQYSLR
jgi:hypothetical protein